MKMAFKYFMDSNPQSRRLFFFFFGHTSKHAVLVPQPGIELVPPVVEVQSLTHWTTREIYSRRHFMENAPCSIRVESKKKKKKTRKKPKTLQFYENNNSLNLDLTLFCSHSQNKAILIT